MTDTATGEAIEFLMKLQLAEPDITKKRERKAGFVCRVLFIFVLHEIFMVPALCGWNVYCYVAVNDHCISIVSACREVKGV